ncbi:TMAO reductase system periplasmic protein TorT [Pelagibius sp. Alg239-R121]|uniref:TMAO reductase system periplasmic protein TorT n=1 Tax=Pelagibius sp. Alg239-R121 TaxID=2993448 RepID=UPI0024A7897A|nr:TMAO reductase system periplasmic protein TorT [Pelagibius sp. Alg239-R121]
MTGFFAFEVRADGIKTWRLEVWEKAFDYRSPSKIVEYEPLQRASRPWRICVAYPHLKDSYWLSVNYGMVQEAQRLGVSFHLVEAGGYPNLERQIAQIRECVERNADALVVGTVSYRGLTPLMQEISRRMPVIAAVNDIADEGITAKSGVSWISMGHAAGAYLAKAHPKGTEPVKIAWFPGPKGAGWVGFVEQGFRNALRESSAEIVVTKWGDTGKEIQVGLVEEALDEHPEIDYIVGNALTAEAAVSILRARELSGRIKVISDYLTHAVFRGIKRGRILTAPTDFPVVQGRLAIEQAVRALEGKLEIRHAGPQTALINGDNINEVSATGSLAPASFTPRFEFNAITQSEAEAPN